MRAAPWAGRPSQRHRARQCRVSGGYLSHRHVDHFAATAAQRLPYRARGLQPAEGVGDGVADEHRSAVVGADQTAGDRGVVAESRPV
jgi:hypothetical protein